MSYSRPAYNAADASWLGAPSYTRPPAPAADAAWGGAIPTGAVAAPSPLGAASLVGSAIPAVDGACVAPSPLGMTALVGDVVTLANITVPSPLGAGATRGAVVTGSRIVVPSPLGAPTLVGTVVRYELRGEVRDQGVLVNRRVRAYRRSDGAFIAEADTVAGLFVILAGFAPDEYYVIAINLDPAATDYTPPTSNRMISVLAMDVAA